jgi:hypothetical protein
MGNGHGVGIEWDGHLMGREWREGHTGGGGPVQWAKRYCEQGRVLNHGSGGAVRDGTDSTDGSTQVAKEGLRQNMSEEGPVDRWMRYVCEHGGIQ